MEEFIIDIGVRIFIYYCFFVVFIWLILVFFELFFVLLLFFVVIIILLFVGRLRGLFIKLFVFVRVFF